MKKLGIFLLSVFLIITFGRALKPGSDAIFEVMNTTLDLSASEQLVWSFMPYIIVAILLGILISYLTGHISTDGGE